MTRNALIALFAVIVAAVLAVSSSAIGPGDITINGPATDTWVSDAGGNYSGAFNMTWADVENLNLYIQANCTLYIGSDDVPHAHGTTMTSRIIANNTASMFAQSSGVQSNSSTTKVYWQIKCFNASDVAYPAGWASEPRVMYFKNTTSISYYVSSKSFTNATMYNSCTGWFNLNATDTVPLYGFPITYQILNSTGKVVGSGSGVNASAQNISFDLGPEGLHFLNVTVADPAGHKNYSVAAEINDQFIFCDETAPVVEFTDITPNALGNNTVVDGSIIADNFAYINFTVTETYNDTITLTFDSTNYAVWGANCTKANALKTCHYNFTGLAEAVNYTVNITVNDTSGNTYTTGNLMFTYDVSAPASLTHRNFTVSASTATYNVSMTEIDPDYCTALMYNYSVALADTLSGSIVVGALTECYGTFTGDDIGIGGAFTLTVNATDRRPSSATSAKTGALKKLYPGWNTLTWTEGATTPLIICSRLTNCEQVSWYNNTAGTFITYSSANPDVYNTTAIGMAEGALIYVNASDYLIMNSHVPAIGSSAVNLTISYEWWNLMGTLGASTVQKILDKPAMNGSATGIIKASFYNGTKFLTCSDADQLCSATSGIPSTVEFQMGDALWVLPNATMIVNRTVDS